MKPPPEYWPRISSSIVCDKPKEEIDWLCTAFGFEVKILVPDASGGVEHSELLFGGGLIMVSGFKAARAHRKSPSSVGGANTQGMFVYVDDIEAHFQRAKAAGAEIVSAPETTDYGPDHWSDRGYECVDPEGHHWWFAQRLRSAST